jgi:hypothetical protein
VQVLAFLLGSRYCFQAHISDLGYEMLLSVWQGATCWVEPTYH